MTLLYSLFSCKNSKELVVLSQSLYFCLWQVPFCLVSLCVKVIKLTGSAVGSLRPLGQNQNQPFSTISPVLRFLKKFIKIKCRVISVLDVILEEMAVLE